MGKVKKTPPGAQRAGREQAEEETSSENIALERGVNYVLAIAIDKYAAPNKPLYNCERDAEDITRILTTKYTFAPENVKKLYNENATYDNILVALDEYSRRLEEKDSLLIIYSGHGENRNGIGFWIPVEAKNFTDYLPLSLIRDYLEPVKARHIFVVSDSCFAGRFFMSTRSGADFTKYTEKHPSRYALTAGRDEPVLDGKPGQNSPFADAFKSVLSNNSDPIGAVMLSEKVLLDVSKKVEGFQTPRHGELNIDGNKHGQFFFHPKKGMGAEEHLATAQLILQLADHVYDPGLYRSAEKHIIFAIENARLDNISLPEALYWQAKAMQSAGDYEAAMQLYSEFIAQNKQTPNPAP